MADAGLLILVVGASGVGKDTLIDAAREAVGGDPSYVFPRREVTRPADAGGEDHVAVDFATFTQRREKGAYALVWEAHGLGYGVPASVVADLAQGRHVVVNVSRTVIEEARARFARVRIVNVVAPPALLAARIAGRGRESAEEALARVARAGDQAIAGADVVTVANDGTLAEGVARFLAALS